MPPTLSPRGGSPLVRDDEYRRLSCWESLLPGVATLFVFLRVYLRRKYNIALGWDDLMIIAAVPFVWGSWATFYLIYEWAAPNGTSRIDPANIPLLLQFIFANIEISVTAINLIKFSIIFFFMRAFGTTRKTQIILWAILIANVLYGIVRTFIVFFLCIPVTDFWNNPLRCKGDQHVYWIAISFIGVVLELIMLVFLLPFIWRLKVPLSRKLGISAVFAVASGVVLACVLRIWWFFKVPNFRDHIFQDWSASTLHLMQELENNVGILVACLPAMHSPMRSVLKSWRAHFRGVRSPPSSEGTPSVASQPPKRAFDLTLGSLATAVDHESELEHQPERSMSLIPFESNLFKAPAKAEVHVRETHSQSRRPSLLPSLRPIRSHNESVRSDHPTDHRPQKQ